MALVLSTPTSQFEAAREDLYRVLFLVAMGAAAAALALAAFAGERIGAGPAPPHASRPRPSARATSTSPPASTTDDELGRARVDLRLHGGIDPHDDGRPAHRRRRGGGAARPPRGGGRRDGRGAGRGRRRRPHHRLQRGGRGGLRPARPRRPRPPRHRRRALRRRRRHRPRRAARSGGPRGLDRGRQPRPGVWSRGARGGVGRYAPGARQRRGGRGVRAPRRASRAGAGAHEDGVPRQHQPRAAHAAHADQGVRVDPADPRPPDGQGEGVRRRDQRGGQPDGAGDRPAGELRHHRRRAALARPAGGARTRPARGHGASLGRPGRRHPPGRAPGLGRHPVRAGRPQLPACRRSTSSSTTP